MYIRCIMSFTIPQQIDQKCKSVSQNPPIGLSFREATGLRSGGQLPYMVGLAQCDSVTFMGPSLILFYFILFYLILFYFPQEVSCCSSAYEVLMKCNGEGLNPERQLVSGQD
jgi:hypothetical protein